MLDAMEAEDERTWPVKSGAWNFGLAAKVRAGAGAERLPGGRELAMLVVVAAHDRAVGQPLGFSFPSRSSNLAPSISNRSNLFRWCF